MKNIIKLNPVSITWVDSKGVTGDWEYLEDLSPLTPCVCTSIGYLLEDKKEYKTLVQTKSANQIVGKICIPSCSIKKIKKIK
jgi:hypothetical protein